MTTARPTWAVAIPAYDAADRIGDALRSLHAQSEPPDEVIVCDDGSHDDLAAALTPFRDMVTLVRQPNRGPSAARNTAAAHVRHADWILFLDSDDWLDIEALAALRDRAAADPDVDLLVLDAAGIDAATSRVLYRHYDRQRFPQRGQQLAILQENFLLTGVSVRRSAFEASGGFDPAIARCEDYELWMRMILDGSRVGLVHGPLLYRRHHADNLSSRRCEMLAWRVEVIRRGLERVDLTAEERGVAATSLRRNERLHRRHVAQHLLGRLAEEATSGRRPLRWRRRAASLLVRAGPRPRQRAALAAGLLAPTAVGHLLGRRRHR